MFIENTKVFMYFFNNCIFFFQLVAYGWDQVSRSFGTFVHRTLCSKVYYCALHDPVWELYQTTRSCYGN